MFNLSLEQQEVAFIYQSLENFGPTKICFPLMQKIQEQVNAQVSPATAEAPVAPAPVEAPAA